MKKAIITLATAALLLSNTSIAHGQTNMRDKSLHLPNMYSSKVAEKVYIADYKYYGVKPGMTVADVYKLWGKARKVKTNKYSTGKTVTLYYGKTSNVQLQTTYLKRTKPLNKTKIQYISIKDSNSKYKKSKTIKNFGMGTFQTTKGNIFYTMPYRGKTVCGVNYIKRSNGSFAYELSYGKLDIE